MLSGQMREGKLFDILQSGIAFFAGTDLDHVLHVVHKDLAVADVAGVEDLLCGLDNRSDGDL